MKNLLLVSKTTDPVQAPVKTLEQAGYVLHVAPRIDDVSDAIRKKQPPDMVLIYLNRSGFTPEEVKKIAKDCETPCIPIVFLFDPSAQETLEAFKDVPNAGVVSVSGNRDTCLLMVVKSALHTAAALKELRDREQRYRELCNNIDSGVAVYEVLEDGKDFIFRFFNKAALSITLEKPEDIIGKSIFEIRPGVEESGFIDFLRSVWKTGKPGTLENNRILIKGRVFFFREYACRLSSGEIFTVFVDVIDLFTIRNNLVRSEEKYRVLVDMSPDPIVQTDLKGDILFSNRSAAKLFGFTTESELTGRSAFDFIHDEDKLRAAEVMKGLLKGGTVGPVEYRAVRSNGMTFPVELHTILIRDIRKQPGTFLGIIRDISGRKQLERQMRFQSELLNVVGQAVISCDSTGAVTFWNRAAEYLLGWSRQEVLGRDFEEFIDTIKPIERTDDILLGNSTYPEGTEKMVLTKKNGTEVPVLMTTTLIAQEDSAQRGIIIIITDITSIKKAEQALKESEERFSLFMEHFPAAVLIQDLNGNFVYVNKKFCETLGRSKDVILRSNERDFLPEDTYEKFHEEDIRVIENNITIESETVYPAPAGERTWRTYKFPLYREGGRTLIGVVSLDVTKRKQAENLIRESEEKYRNIFESSPIALWEEDISELQKNLDRLRKRGITDIKKYIQENPEFLPEALAMITVTGVNNATLELYNVKDKNEFIGKLEQIITPDDIPFLADQIEALYQGAPSIEGEKHEKTFKGDEKDFYIKIAFPQDPSDHRQIVSIVDITERKQLIKSLHTALEEKELLMRELQHRTKNTITLISSIINLESRHVHDDHALSLLDSIRNRLSAIAQVYQSLYQQENIGRVDLKRYLTEIAESFIDLYKSGKQKVVFQTDMDDVQLDIKRGTSFGLIVTELLTNSLKHGISDKEARSFIIRFTLRKRENHLVFTISDNGFPLLENFSMTKTDSFGLNMISYLVQDLDGEINWSQEEGWKHFSLSIPV